MSHIRLRCTSCGAQHPADIVTLACRDCGAPLDVEYLRLGGGGSGGPSPLHGVGPAILLGEGSTPSVSLPAAGALLGLRRLYGKLELMNPTGSFKDRGTAVMMAVVSEHGVEEVAEDSSGNAGASVSAYAGRSGVRAHIFVPADAPVAKLRQIEVYGAEVHLVEGSRETVAEAAATYCADRGLVYASHALSPYFLEGTKSFAYEVARRSDDGDGLPDHIVFPVGNGSLLIGSWKGFRELRDAGDVAEMPRLHAVQARAVMPLVAAHTGKTWAAGATKRTVAGGIAVSAPPRMDQMLAVLRETEGAAVAVEDSEVLRWQGLLAEKEGVFAEPTSAAAFAGVEQLVRRGFISAGDSVLVPVTGFGLKDDSAV